MDSFGAKGLVYALPGSTRLEDMVLQLVLVRFQQHVLLVLLQRPKLLRIATTYSLETASCEVGKVRVNESIHNNLP